MFQLDMKASWKLLLINVWEIKEFGQLNSVLEMKSIDHQKLSFKGSSLQENSMALDMQALKNNFW